MFVNLMIMNNFLYLIVLWGDPICTFVVNKTNNVLTPKPITKCPPPFVLAPKKTISAIKDMSVMLPLANALNKNSSNKSLYVKMAI